MRASTRPRRTAGPATSPRAAAAAAGMRRAGFRDVRAHRGRAGPRMGRRRATSTSSRSSTRQSLFDELDREERARDRGARSCAAATGSRAEELTLRLPIVYVDGARSRRLTPPRARSAEGQPSSTRHARSHRTRRRHPRQQPRPRRPRPRRPRPRRPRRRRGSSSTRGGRTLATTSSGSVRSVGVGRDLEVADVDRVVERAQRLDRVVDRLREVIRQRADANVLDRRGAGCRRRSRPPRTRPRRRAARRPSAPRSSARRTGRRGAGGGSRGGSGRRARGPARPCRRRPTGRSGCSRRRGAEAARTHACRPRRCRSPGRGRRRRRAGGRRRAGRTTFLPVTSRRRGGELRAGGSGGHAELGLRKVRSGA